MYTNDELIPVVENVELLLAELRGLRSSGPHFRILHRFREPGCDCAPGEEIAAVYLVHRFLETPVPLSLTLRLLFDFMAKHSHLPQNPSQIVAAMHVDPFYRKHGANAKVEARLTRKFSRSSIKEYMKRIRLALQQVFRQANLGFDPQAVLISEQTITNEVGYRLKAAIEWVHIDHPGRNVFGGEPGIKSPLYEND